MSVVNIALVQKSAAPNKKWENLNRLSNCVKEAKKKGADLVLFPEMWSNGYAPPFPDAFNHPFHPAYEKERNAWLNEAVSDDDAYMTSLKKIAAEYQIGICATFLSHSSKGFQNSAAILDRQGQVLLNYAKVHTCDFSLEALLHHGDEFFVCDFDHVKLGVMICYDREFPESARILMLKGAEIILVPNACDMNPARLQQLSSRAFENMVGVAMANYPGKQWGHSCAYSPIVFDEKGAYIDNLMISADDCTEDILIATFDLDRLRAFRKRETWGNAYRKPRTYSDLVRTEINDPFIRSSPASSAFNDSVQGITPSKNA